MFLMLCTGGQSYCVGMWSGHRYKEPALQAVHAMWSFGATIGPFIIGRFLVELPSQITTANAVVNWTSTSSSVSETTGITLTGSFSGFACSLLCSCVSFITGVTTGFM